MKINNIDEWNFLFSKTLIIYIYQDELLVILLLENDERYVIFNESQLKH